MVAGVVHDDDPRRASTDKLFADLDRFASTPTGSLTIVLLTLLVRLLVPVAARRRARRKIDKTTGAIDNA